LKRVYKSLPSISIDYAVMEKMKNVHCLLAPFQWSDLGGWLGISEFWPRDNAHNRVHGRAILVKSERNIVKAKERLVALLGVQDLLVVDTPDALLIAPRSRTEEIREVVRELERRKHLQYL
jgi:mannose-1-phosphate guanylyltransferase